MIVMAQGDFELPAVREQDADVARKQAWRRSFMPKHNYRAGRLAVVCQLLCDELVSDLGLQKFRKASPLPQHLDVSLGGGVHGQVSVGFQPWGKRGGGVEIISGK
jgi:hypothetical protein